VVLDGRTLLVSASCRPQIALWDPTSGDLVSQFTDPDYSFVHKLWVAQLDDRAVLICSVNHNRTLRVFDVGTGEIITTVHIPDTLGDVEHAPDVRLVPVSGGHVLVVLTGGSRIIRVYDVRSGEQAYDFRVSDLYVSLDGALAVVDGDQVSVVDLSLNPTYF
jgi:WD40 repeat protein